MGFCGSDDLAWWVASVFAVQAGEVVGVFEAEFEGYFTDGNASAGAEDIVCEVEFHGYLVLEEALAGGLLENV